MADQRFNQGEDAPRQAAGAPATSGRADDRSSATADRERTIATGRDTPRSHGLSRRATAPAFGAGLGPFSLIRRMTEDMDRLFENFALGRGLGLDRDLWSGRAADSTWMPQVEVFKRDNNVVVRADLPGMKKEDVKLEVNEGLLTISGERCDEREENRDDFFRSERSYGQFYRAIPLPEGVSAEQCEATFKDGVLEVTIPTPKQADKKANRVTIR
jgi:HSP20 family protein